MPPEKDFPEQPTEKNIFLNLATAEHRAAILALGKALSSPVRIDILNLVKLKPLSLQEISRILNLPLSSASMHVRCLEEARLLSVRSQPGRHGSMRVCTCGFVSAHLDAYDTRIDAQDHTLRFDMPVGNYSDFQVVPTCGLAGMEGIIDSFDDPASFYSPERQKAQLIWFRHGFLEYRFPNRINPLLALRELSFSLELCSEAPGYDESWPSDITFFINGREIGTYTVQGDFGTRRGQLTPDVWPMGRTQYGLMLFVSLRPDGGYINKKRVNPDVTLDTVDLHAEPYISFRIQVREDAQNCGGINIFGEKYGDYPQGITLRITH